MRSRSSLRDDNCEKADWERVRGNIPLLNMEMSSDDIVLNENEVTKWVTSYIYMIFCIKQLLFIDMQFEIHYLFSFWLVTGTIIVYANWRGAQKKENYTLYCTPLFHQIVLF